MWVNEESRSYAFYMQSLVGWSDRGSFYDEFQNLMPVLQVANSGLLSHRVIFATILYFQFSC